MRAALMGLTQGHDAAVTLGGKPVAWHQLQALLGVGCERVICLAEGPGPVLAALQRETEARGARFSAITHHRTLSGLVRGADTLLVLAPGVLPDREWLSEALGARTGIGVFTADGAIERGFERIDQERAWAGALGTPGDAVETLADLPPDADPIAGLLRVALQRGGRSIDVPNCWLDDGRWALLNDMAAAKRFEESWQARHVPAPPAERPGEVFAHRLARRLLRGAGEMPAIIPLLALGGTLLAVVGGAVGYGGNTLAGITLLTFGTLVTQVGERMRHFARAAAGGSLRLRDLEIRDTLLDLSLVAIASSPEQFAGWQVAFIATVLVAAVRLAREEGAAGLVRSLGDRLIVFGLLLLATGFGQFAPAAAVLALLALAGRLFWPSRLN